MSDLDKIKQLRQSTGAGFKDCGSALEEAKGNLDKAAEMLHRAVQLKSDDGYIIKEESVMKTALEVLTEISSNNKITLKAEGDLIPNAVAVANIVTENMLKGNTSIQDIKLDSVISNDDGIMTSNIKITIIKN